MSLGINAPCDESSGCWLPLTEYAVRTGTSTSTLRRKIKKNTIQHRLEQGKYLIWYGPDDKSGGWSQPAARPSAPPVIQSVTATAAESNKSDTKEAKIQALQAQNKNLQEKVEELSLLVKLLEETYGVKY